MRKVRGDESKLGVHGGGAEVDSALEGVNVDKITGSVGDPAPKVEPTRLLEFYFVVEVLEDGEDLVRGFHADGTVETKIGKRFDDLALFRGAAAYLEGIDVEAEGTAGVERPLG